MTGRPSQVPVSARAWLRASAIFLVVVAAVGNIGHTFEFLTHAGQFFVLAGFGAISPDVLLVSSVIRLRYDRWHFWSWVGLAASTGVVLWAGFAMAPDGFTAKAVSAWPVVVAVIAAGLMETGTATAREAEAEKWPDLPAAAPQAEPVPELVPELRPVVAPELVPFVPAEPRRAVAAETRRPRAAAKAQSVPDCDLPAELVQLGQTVAGEIAEAGQGLSRDRLVAGIRAHGQSISTPLAGHLLRHLKAAAADPAPHLLQTSADTP